MKLAYLLLLFALLTAARSCVPESPLARPESPLAGPTMVGTWFETPVALSANLGEDGRYMLWMGGESHPLTGVYTFDGELLTFSVPDEITDMDRSQPLVVFRIAWIDANSATWTGVSHEIPATVGVRQ